MKDLLFTERLLDTFIDHFKNDILEWIYTSEDIKQYLERQKNTYIIKDKILQKSLSNNIIKLHYDNFKFISDDWCEYDSPYDFISDKYLWHYYLNCSQDIKNILELIFLSCFDKRSINDAIKRYWQNIVEVILNQLMNLWIIDYKSNIFYPHLTEYWNKLYEECILNPLEATRKDLINCWYDLNEKPFRIKYNTNCSSQFDFHNIRWFKSPKIIENEKGLDDLISGKYDDFYSRNI